MENLNNNGLMAAFSGVNLLFGIGAWIFSGFVMMALAKKTNTPNGWLGFVPIANLFLMVNIAKLPWWWLLLLFVPFVNIIVGIYIWWKISENIGKPGWWSLLLFIPVVNIVIL
ncbi:MAG: DUF5684 domain-containing protein, partial [Desulfocucumaceae bacterium]